MLSPFYHTRRVRVRVRVWDGFSEALHRYYSYYAVSMQETIPCCVMTPRPPTRTIVSRESFEEWIRHAFPEDLTIQEECLRYVDERNMTDIWPAAIVDAVRELLNPHDETVLRGEELPFNSH